MQSGFFIIASKKKKKKLPIRGWLIKNRTDRRHKPLSDLIQNLAWVNLPTGALEENTKDCEHGCSRRRRERRLRKGAVTKGSTKERHQVFWKLEPVGKKL